MTMALRRRPICNNDLQSPSSTRPMTVPTWAERVRLGPRAAHTPPDSETNSVGTLPRLLTIAQVAEGLHVSQKTVRRMIAGGQLRAVRLGCSLRVTTRDYQTLIDSS